MKNKIDKETEFLLRKENADKNWDKTYKELSDGKIDRELIVHAVAMCNISDKALLNLEYAKNFR